MRRGNARFFEPRLVCAEMHGLDYLNREWLCVHKCKSETCINPEHLEPRHKSEKYTARTEYGKHGQKLTEQEAIEIKYTDWSPLSDREVGEMFNISRAMVGQIKRGTTWRHI